MEALEPRYLLATSVLSYHNDLASSGVNSTETLLTPSSVTVPTFQKQFSTPVDGQVYAQPLYVPGLNITGGNQPGIHNTVFVATQHNSLYAIDSSGGNILWQISFLDTTNPKVNLLGASSITTVPALDVGSADILPEIGTTATPVIDPATKMLYVEVKSKQLVDNNVEAPHYVHTLFKVDIAAGKVADSTIIGDTIFSGGNFTYRTTDTGTGTDPYVVGTGHGAITVGTQSRVYFNALRQMDRPGLVLWNGHVITAYASHGDNGPYHGWVLMHDAATLKIKGAFNTTPNGGLGGIWQAGGVIAIDPQGYMYFETGNGTFDSNNGVPQTAEGFQGNANYGDSFLKIGLDATSTEGHQNGNPNGWGLKLFDYFSPFNNAQLDSVDADLGSGGVTILPDSAGNEQHPHLLVGSGKEGKLYLVDRDNMGKFDIATDHVVQTVGNGINGSLNTPAFFNGRLYYFPGYSGPGRSFALSNATIGTYQQTPDAIGFLNGTPSISANGTLNGIVWVIDRGSNQLKAYDAHDLTKQLWTSGQAPDLRDQLGSVVKFTVPTVADGQVFVGTANSLVIYGPPIPVTAPPDAPTQLTLVPRAFNKVDLTWTDLSNNEDKFLIERSPDNADWAEIGAAGANATKFSDTTALSTTTYYYRVRAHNTFQTDSFSAYVSAGPVTTPEAPPTGTGDGLAAAYYDNAPHLKGTPVLTRNDATIDFEWGVGSPDPAVPADLFSVRWTGTILPDSTQIYKFHTLSDDGIRVWVNDNLIIDNWNDHGPSPNDGFISLPANTPATVKVEFYENGGGATVRLHWSSPLFSDTPVPFQGAGAVGEYFVDTAGFLIGTPLLKRVDPVVDSTVIWDGGGSPDASVGSQNFSVKWTGQVQPQVSETYTFHTVSDDGVRLWVNDQLLIDNWTFHPATDNFGTISLSAGQKYDIEMDFFQGCCLNVAQLRWSSNTTEDTVIPQSQLYSGVAPAAPDQLSVVAASGTELDLTWRDNSHIETGFSVERSNDGVNFTPIATHLPADTQSYFDTALDPDMRYWYRVQALNFAENSAYSNVVDLTTPVPPNKPTNAHPTAVTTTSIAFAWTDPADNEDGYRITRAVNFGSFVAIATLPPNTTTYLDQNLKPGQHHEYHIQAFNIAGFNDFTGFNTETLTLPPTGLTAGAGPNLVRLSWTAPTASVPLQYSVYRGTSAGGEDVTPLVTGIRDTSYTDRGLTPDQPYYYFVTAVDDGGESDRSSEAVATPINTPPPRLEPIARQSADVADIVTVSTVVTAASIDEMTASVDWGDGTIEAATLQVVDGVIRLIGQHTYNNAGKFPVHVSVTDAGNRTVGVDSLIAISRYGNLVVTGGSTAVIVSLDGKADYDFTAAFTAEGLQLVGRRATTFNGQSTLTVPGASAFVGYLGRGEDRVRITGTGKATFVMDAGQDNLTLQNDSGVTVQTYSYAGLDVNAFPDLLKPHSDTLFILGTANPWQNPHDPLDVNHDGFRSAIDVLVNVNYQNFHPNPTNAKLTPPASADPPAPGYLDVNGDGFASPIDIALVVSYLNRPKATVGASRITLRADGEFASSTLRAEGEAAGVSLPTAFVRSVSATEDTEPATPAPGNTTSSSRFPLTWTPVLGPTAEVRSAELATATVPRPLIELPVRMRPQVDLAKLSRPVSPSSCRRSGALEATLDELIPDQPLRTENRHAHDAVFAELE